MDSLPTAAFHSLPGVERARSLGEGVVMKIGRGRLQEPLHLGEGGLGATMGCLVRLVDQCRSSDGDGRRAAGAAPRLPRGAAVEGGVERQVAGGIGTVRDDVDAGLPGGAGAAVRPDDDVVVGDLGRFLIESQPVPPNCVEAPTLIPLTESAESLCRTPARRCRSRRSAWYGPLKPLWIRSASWLAASNPSLSTSRP